ncbi:MAG TPA: hypothetical protein ENN09_06200 [Planctomycetes bacterium]|nr:hypothetical protein [Planctomycetota bacterium]
MKRLSAALLVSAVILQALVLYASVLPLTRHTPAFIGEDKVLHFAAFAVIGLLLALGSAAGGRGYLYAGALLSGFFVSVLSEVLQKWVPMRRASFYDALANVLGLLAVIAVYEGIRLWRRGGILYAEVLAPPPKGTVDNETKSAKNS